jgi:putative ABC transport system substrate-binding protein
MLTGTARGLILLLGGAVAWPLAATAQPTVRVFRLGYLSSYSAESGRALLACFQDGLRQLGWVEGTNVTLITDGLAVPPHPWQALAAELVSLNPDLIVVASTPGTQAMQKATGQIPVVFVGVSDPVASGIVASLARPEANITGVSNFLPATSGKLIELLRTMVPTASRFVVLRDPNNAGKQLAELKQAAHEMGVALEAVDARAINEVEGALSAIAAMGADALYHATRRRNIDKSLSDR